MPNKSTASGPHGDRPQPGSPGSRLLGVGLAGAWGLAASAVVSLTTVASVFLGWLVAGLVYFAGFYPSARVFGLRRRAGFAVATALALVGGVLAYQSMPPGKSQLGVVAWRVGMPEGWERVSSKAYGNALCFDECPTLRRVYLAPVPVDEAIDVLTEHFAALGLEGRGPRRPPTGSGESWGTWTRGRVEVSASFLAPGAPSAVGSDPETSTVVLFYTGR